MVADNFVIDGEILLTERDNIPSKLQYKATSKIVSAKNPEKHGVTINAFDWVSTAVWEGQLESEPYSERYESLKKTLNATNPKHIHLVENLYEGSDVSVIDKMIVDAKAKEWEGLMVRFVDSKYQWKRSKDLLKVKPFQEMDVIIKGYEEGTNSNTGRLGAFHCEITLPDGKFIKAKVGGGFSEEERINFWSEKDSLIGRVISVQYFEITNNEEGQYSLRFPEFLELKEEGQDPNN